MDTPSYIAKNQDDLFDQCPPDIQAIIYGNELNTVTAILGKVYKIPVSSYVALENIISFILIGALKPEDAVRGIVDILHLSEEDAYKLAADLDKTILEKARISIHGKSPHDMVTLTFQEGRSPDELRKEILDTTNREQDASIASSIPTPPTSTKPTLVTGSRSQLMEQLQILDAIPDDEEIADRLKKIQAQITGMNAVDEHALTSNIALQEFMPKDEHNTTVAPATQAATYSKAPTKYNVDPYREIAEDIQ